MFDLSRSVSCAAALGLAALTLVGCIDTDAAVFVEPTIAQPSAQVTSGLLGVSATGSFELSLHLGPRASGESQVSLEAFSIQSADETATILDPLPLAETTERSLAVQPDSTKTMVLSFDTGANLLAAEVRAQLCAPGGVRIKGVIDDALKGGPTPVVSAPFSPAGC
jgi:hypothetical protein